MPPRHDNTRHVQLCNCWRAVTAGQHPQQQDQQQHAAGPLPADCSRDKGKSRSRGRSSCSRLPPWSRSSNICRSRTSVVLLLLVLLPSCNAALAQPCIECSQCLTANCQRICSSSCARYGGPGRASGDQCKNIGETAADDVADQACKTIQVSCPSGLA